MRFLIVSRHPAAVEFIRTNAPDFAGAEVKAVATADDVRGAVVGGNLPLHLAALAVQVVAVEFTGDPPRGAEYGQAEMIAAGARLARYTVAAVPESLKTLAYSDGIGNRGRQSKLIVGRGEAIHEFVGASIPGVVAVTGSDYTKNGKWSHTDYRLQFAPTAWASQQGQSWEEGQWFHGCASPTAVVAVLRKAGCQASENAVIAFLDATFPKTMERIRAAAAALASVAGEPSTKPKGV